MRTVIATSLLLLPSLALAEVDPKCASLPKPPDYDEQVQQDFQQNFFALAASASPVHGAIPHAPGHGSIHVDASILPPLTCEQRFVLDWTKTEDTNKSPILPRIGAGFSFPAIKDVVVPYASVAILPPIPVGGTRNLVLSGDAGLGGAVHEHVEIGARFHASMIRTYGDVATAFTADEPAIEDVFVGSTWGFDALVSFPVDAKGQHLNPFVSVGYTNASTFFFVGDSAYVATNLHPYSGPAISAGLDALFKKHLRLGGEFYAAPGGFSLPDKTATSVDGGFSRYGHLYTGRFRIGYEF